MPSLSLPGCWEFQVRSYVCMTLNSVNIIYRLCLHMYEMITVFLIFVSFRQVFQGNRMDQNFSKAFCKISNDILT